MKINNFWTNHFQQADKKLLNHFLTINLDQCKDIFIKHQFNYDHGEVFESAENRVFGFKDVVIKFYRPQRWSYQAIKEELDFLDDLRLEGVDCPTPLSDVETYEGLHYVIFQRIQQPFLHEQKILNEDSVKKLVHVAAKIHKAGANKKARHRMTFDPKSMSHGCFEVIKKAQFLPLKYIDRYEKVLEDLVYEFSRFKDFNHQRVHGDIYTGNIIWKNDTPIIIDFDDFQIGPTAIDLKLLSSSWRLDTLNEKMDYFERRIKQHQIVMKFYRQIHDFPKEHERAFPLFSAYRDVQFDAWFSARWTEPGFASQYPDDDITKEQWWLDSIKGIEECIKRSKLWS